MTQRLEFDVMVYQGSRLVLMYHPKVEFEDSLEAATAVARFLMHNNRLAMDNQLCEPVGKEIPLPAHVPEGLGPDTRMIIVNTWVDED